MTPFRSGIRQSKGPMTEGTEIVRWRRGPAPFQVIVQNSSSTYWTYITGNPGDKTGYVLREKKSETDQANQFVINVPAAERGESVEDESIYFFNRHNAITAVYFAVQPSAGNTMPSVEQPAEVVDADFLAALEAEITRLSRHYPKEEAMPLVLQPIDQKAKAQLATQLACWAKMDNGMTDPAVQFGTCCVSPTGETLGRWTIPDGLCDPTVYGPLPFTGNNGQTITCPPTQADIMPYYIYDADVDPFDPNTCVQIPEPLAAPTNLATSSVTATGMTVTWTAVDGADGYNVQYSADGGNTWTAVSPNPTTPTVALSGLTGGTTYTIRVRATDSTGTALTGPWASITESTAPSAPTPLAAPTNLTGTSPAAGQLSASWDAVTDADGYVFEYSDDAGATWTPVEATATNVGPITVAAGTYQIRVLATDSTGEFADSPYATGADVVVA